MYLHKENANGAPAAVTRATILGRLLSQLIPNSVPARESRQNKINRRRHPHDDHEQEKSFG